MAANEPNDFKDVWVALLDRPNIKQILAKEMTTSRRISKICCTIAADQFGVKEFEWYQEKKKVAALEERVKKVRQSECIHSKMNIF